MMQRISAAACCALFTLVATHLSVAPAQEPAGGPIKIGMAKSIFVDVPPLLVKFVGPSFSQLTRECTGLNGQMVVGGDPFELCKQLHANDVQLAVFQGIEFAWVQEKHPELMPIMVAVYRHHQLKANLVVRKDNPMTGFAELRGTDLALPRKSKEHCRLFLERLCSEGGQCEPKTFFNQVTRPSSMEEALDEVCAGKVQACIMDAAALENYQNIKPGCAARLRIAKQSETFPCAVICCRKGALPEDILNKFRAGMLNANKNDRTRELMNLYMITSFEPLPDDYLHTVTEILKSYPAPVVSFSPAS